MIKKSIEDLPFPNARAIHAPSKQPFFAQAIGDAWYAQYKADGKDTLELAIPEAGPYRASYAGKRCDRQLYYALMGLPETNPSDLADAWRFELGHRVHDMAQEMVERCWPDGENEVNVDLNAIGIPGSAHVDTVITHEGHKTVVEIKSATGFSFKMATTTFSGPPEGPKFSAILQGAMAAKALGAERLVIVNFALENLSKSWAYGEDPVTRFAGEWHFLVSDLEEAIAFEVARIEDILKMVALEEVPEPYVHDPGEVAQGKLAPGARITDPTKGLWIVEDDEPNAQGIREIVDTGKYWLCGYCEQRDRCQKEGTT